MGRTPAGRTGISDHTTNTKNYMSNLLVGIVGILPIFTSLFVILALRQSTVRAALTGLICALIVYVRMHGFSFSQSQLFLAVSTAALLTASATVVILPGLYLNAMLQALGNVTALSHIVSRLKVDDKAKILFLLLGFAPAVESITGFGVSLFFSIPLFFAITSNDKAIELSLLSMNVMPWGTLALPTILGASLIAIPVDRLASMTALTSFFVFPTIGLIGVFVIDGWVGMRTQFVRAILLGLGISTFLFLFSRAGYTEIAGVLSGASVCLIAFAQERIKARYFTSTRIATAGVTARASDLIRPLLPFFAVLGLIILSRSVLPVRSFLSHTWVIDSGRIQYAILSSPGIIIALVAIALMLLRKPVISHTNILSKARAACTSLFIFALLAQFLRETGMLSGFSVLLAQWSKVGELEAFIVPLLGMLSGNITGSNVGGNALMMPLVHDFGLASGAPLLFAAMQNSAAGHAVFTSSALIVLTRTIALANHGKMGGEIRSESELLWFAIRCAIFVFLALIAGFLFADLVSSYVPI
jgi:lactate permease